MTREKYHTYFVHIAHYSDQLSTFKWVSTKRILERGALIPQYGKKLFKIISCISKIISHHPFWPAFSGKQDVLHIYP